MEYLPNKLTPFNFKIYYKKKNYLKVKIVVFKYTTLPIVKGSVCWYIGTSAYPHISTFSRSYILSFIM